MKLTRYSCDICGRTPGHGCQRVTKAVFTNDGPRCMDPDGTGCDLCDFCLRKMQEAWAAEVGRHKELDGELGR